MEATSIVSFITKFPVGSKDKHPDFKKLVNYTMSETGSSSDLSVSSFSGSLGSITSTGTATDSTLTKLNVTYIPSSPSTCTAPLSESLDSQESVVVVSTVSAIFNFLSCMKLISISLVVIISV